MSPEEKNAEEEPDRTHLLEEIRRRAEEAELRRIEDEEKETKRAGGGSKPKPKGTEPAPFPVPNAEPPPPSATIAKEQKVVVLKERLVIALERGRTDKAAEILAELTELIPNDPALAGYQSRIIALREEKQRAAAESRRPVEPPAKEQPKSARVDSAAQQKQISELLESATAFYQQERYDKGLEDIQRILALDEFNEDAQRLREQIAKAQKIAELIQREEARRKAEESAQHPPPLTTEAPPLYAEDKDVWGTSGQLSSDTGYELAPEEKGPVGPPRPSLFTRMAIAASRIHIPVKFLLTVFTIGAVGVAAYFIIDHIRTAVAPPTNSIILLPAAVSSGDSSLELLADGFTEGLIADLSSVAELRVIDGPSSFALRGSPVTASRISRSFGANYYLQSSMARVGDVFIVQTNLFDTTSARPVWVTRTQAAGRDLANARLELARKLLGVMRVKPNADEAILLERSQTNSPAAYEAYLRGRAILRAPEEYPASAAIEPLLDATHADSLFGDAHAALGWAYVLAYETEQDAPPSYVLQASSSVQRAIVLGAKGSETFRVWGTIEQFRGNIAKARERFDQAVAMSPSDAESQRRLARICLIQGQYDLALKAAKRSAIDDPANVEALSMLGKVQQFIGEYVHAGENEAKESRASLMDAAHSYEMAMRMAHDRSEFGAGLYADVLVYIQQPDRSIEIYNDRIARDRDSYIDFYKLGRVDQTAGRPKQEWEEAFLRAKSILGVRLQEEPEDAVAFSVLALVETRLGGFKEALAASRRALELAPTDLDVLFNTARMYALQRDKGTALQYLQRALTRKYSIAHLLDMDFYNLRAEPEFIRAISG